MATALSQYEAYPSVNPDSNSSTTFQTVNVADPDSDIGYSSSDEEVIDSAIASFIGESSIRTADASRGRSVGANCQGDPQSLLQERQDESLLPLQVVRNSSSENASARPQSCDANSVWSPEPIPSDFVFPLKPKADAARVTDQPIAGAPLHPSELTSDMLAAAMTLDKKSAVAVVNKALHDCALRGDDVDAKFLFTGMSTLGMQPNSITYGCVIRACATAGNLPDVERWLIQMIVHGYELDHATYAKLFVPFIPTGMTVMHCRKLRFLAYGCIIKAYACQGNHVRMMRWVEEVVLNEGTAAASALCERLHRQVSR